MPIRAALERRRTELLSMSRAIKGLAVGLPLSLILWAGIMAVVSWLWSLL